jgi:hypothetical protein
MNRLYIRKYVNVNKVCFLTEAETRRRQRERTPSHTEDEDDNLSVVSNLTETRRQLRLDLGEGVIQEEAESITGKGKKNIRRRI